MGKNTAKRFVTNWERKLRERTQAVVSLTIAALLVAFALLVSCKTQQAPPVLNNSQTTTHTEIVHIRDTIIKTEPDSASINALLECDSLNNVLIRQLDVQAGEHIKPSINITPKEDGTVGIEFDCKHDSLEHEIAVRDKIIETLRNSQTEIPVYIEKEQSQFLRNSGIALWVLIGIFLVAVIIGIVLKFAK